MSRTVAERKTVGTAQYFYRAGAAHLPRACVPGTRVSGTRGGETPQQAPQGVYVHPLAIQGGGTAEWKRGNKIKKRRKASLGGIPLTERRAPCAKNSGIY